MKNSLKASKPVIRKSLTVFKLHLNLDEEFKIIRENFSKKIGRDYAASRGEYLNGIVMANYLG